jgi:hypothetical protein
MVFNGNANAVPLLTAQTPLPLRSPNRVTDANQRLPYLLIYLGIVVRAWHEFDKIHIVWKETVRPKRNDVDALRGWSIRGKVMI